MKLKNLIVLVLALCLLPSCQELMAKLKPMLTPKASPEMVSEIMAKAEKIGFSSPRKLGKSKKDRLKIKAGQWVTTLTTHKDVGNDRLLSTVRVIHVDGSTVVLETESYSALGKCERQLTQMTFENYPIKSKLSYTQEDIDDSLRAMKITKVVTKNGDEPAQELPEQALMMYQQIGKNMTGVSMRSGDMTSDACPGTYIESARCYDFDFTVSVMGITQTGRVTAHSDIPVNGMVRMETPDMVQETIAFGSSGAQSQM
ncbi:MAG: hypothetical protein KKD44_12385 [Proteobacteria bacterium]|nr:hypothetical protein [Pseudomonadota bacterium]